MMVVSEIGEQWSPHTAPAMQAEMEIIIRFPGVFSNTCTTMGIRIPKVPQEVPVAKAKKHATMKIIAGSIFTSPSAEEEVSSPAVYATFWSLVPPVVAIVLALITKEVYSSLFVGILVGAILYSGGNFEVTVNQIFSGGMISVLSSSSNVGILVFLVILGTMDTIITMVRIA